jgi:multidrug efflux pump subunit AcrA (membrane-fusion protein)
MDRRIALPLRWLIVPAVLAGLVLLAYAVHSHMVQQRLAEAGGDRVVSPVMIEKRKIHLGQSQAELNGIKETPAEKVSWTERVTAYGLVVPNPRATVEIRAPFAGTLKAEPGVDWPAPGQRVKAKEVIGRLQVRVGPQELLDWKSKLNEAQAKQQLADESLKIQQDKLARLKNLGGTEAVSRRELDEALLQAAEARANQAAARDAVKLWQDALTEGERASGSIWSRALIVAAEGEVAELAARPGSSLEAGALVARVVDFRRVLVRLEMPPEALAGGPPEIASFIAATVRSASLGPSAAGSAAGQNLSGKFVGPAPQVDGASQRAAYWYEVASESVPRDWRPGYPVKAAVPLPGSEPREAVAIPTSSLLYHQGYPLVYVRVDPDRYERRDVEVLGRAGNRWVLGRGVRPGEAVVSAQAQLLLSAEFNQAGDND